ncbi:FecR family protein [Pedobacter sp. ok626]|uniref:FecR family protein n=1 Tax=Pedobacter sp. ok626 TaxID=1761882 RepID=UPI000888C94E|nr:FecR family protein [Pedobacter sp. ok626]SDK15738.1 FecR family protein [Pedobacter sp. ok626]
METQTNHLQELAKRYKAGLCTPEEIEKINEWYDHFEEYGYRLPDEHEIDRASNEAAIAAIRKVSLQEKKGRIRRLLWPALKTAAILLMICSVGLLVYKRNNSKSVAIYHETSALAGEKKQIRLSDGSLISINSESSIRYPEVFNGATREIYLKGEAFFEISHDKQHPFIIQTEQLKVKVLGTSFGVKAYHQDEQIEVAVATGKVGVVSNRKSNNKEWLLIPGEQMSYNKSTGNFSKQQVLTTDIRNWQQNILVFNFETLENISKKLERVYGVTFVFKDKSVLKKRFQLKVKNEALSNIMKLLSISAEGLRYKISGKQVTIG